jgi:hypothetical protein
MGLLNTHQLLSGARRPGTIKTYVTSLVKERPTITAPTAGQVTFDGGIVEFDGRDWSLDGLSIDFDLAAPLLRSNTEYVIGAVPKYEEPIDKITAEGLGLNYYVSQDPTTKEFYATYFIPSAVEAAVMVYGGWDALQKKAWTIGLSGAEKLAFDDYSEQLNRLSDPRFTGKLMSITGVEFMLAEVYPQDNSSSTDKTLSMTEGEFTYFLSSQGFVPSNRLTTSFTITDPVAGAGTFFTAATGGGLPVPPSQKMYRLSSISLYKDAVSATANVNPFPVPGSTLNDLIQAFDFVTEPTPDGLGWTTVYAVVYEHYMPSYMALGHTGYEDGVVRYITKEQIRAYGRVNPVYLHDSFAPMRVGGVRAKARPALMWYADPACLCKVKTGPCTPTNVDLDATYGVKVVRDDELGGR